LRNFITGFFFT